MTRPGACAFAFFLCCSALNSVQAKPADETPFPLAVRTQEQWSAVQRSGQKTPLDALTPYGKRRFVGALKWGDNGLGGFSYAPLVRELNDAQLAAVLVFLDSESSLPTLRAMLDGGPLRLPAPSATVEQGLEQLEQFAASENEKRRSASSFSTTLGAQPLLRYYLDLFGKRMAQSALQRQPLGDLPLLFDAAALVDGEFPGSPALGHLLLVHGEMAARGIDTRRGFDVAVLKALIGARRFEQARTFAAARPHLGRQAVPKVVDALGAAFAGRSAYQYDAASKTLTRQAVPYPAGHELVMVVDAGCHFSRDALEALRGDADLQARLRKANLVLVTPPRSAISLGFIGNWNAANPSLPLRVPYDVREWQQIDVAGVPEFYLLKGGRVVGQLRSGWPAGGNKAALLRLLDAGASEEGSGASGRYRPD
jgi:hypothetical protein